MLCIKTQTMMINEGKKRLRIFVSASVVAVTYLVQIFSDEVRYLDAEEIFIQFPLVSLIIGVIGYFGITGSYWVYDGFSRPKSTSINNIPIRIDPSALNKICNEAMLELHCNLKNIVPTPVTGLKPIDDISSTISNSWKRPCLAYCYGLVSINMLKRDPDFFQSKANKELTVNVLEQMTIISSNTIQSIGHNSKPEKHLIQAEAKDIQQVISGVKFFLKQIIIKQKDPLTILIAYLCKSIGVNDDEQFNAIREDSKLLLSKIDGLIEKHA